MNATKVIFATQGRDSFTVKSLLDDNGYDYSDIQVWASKMIAKLNGYKPKDKIAVIPVDAAGLAFALSQMPSLKFADFPV